MAQDDTRPFEGVECCEQTGRVDPRVGVSRNDQIGVWRPRRGGRVVDPGPARGIDENAPPDRKQPTTIAAVAAKPRGIAPRAQKSFLRQIIRRIDAGDPGQEAAEPRLVPPDKDRKGAAVARCSALVKGDVVFIHPSQFRWRSRALQASVE